MSCAVRFFFFLSLTIRLFSGGSTAADQYDLLIQGGRIVDGSGAASYVADIAVDQGKIVKIGQIPGDAARQIIDAQGLIVAPGFVDTTGEPPMIFSRSMSYLRNRLAQGITTIHCGDGDSAVPYPGRAVTPYRSSSMAEYFLSLEMQGLPLNMVQSIGHKRLRRLAGVGRQSAASAEQLEKMGDLIRNAMRVGAIGVSSDLQQLPASTAQMDELVALAEAANQHEGRLYLRLRNEGDQLLESVDEALEVGRRSGAGVHFFHFQASGPNNWDKLPDAIKKINEAGHRGQEISADVSPYLHEAISSYRFLSPQDRRGNTILTAWIELEEQESRDSLRKSIETTANWNNWYHYAGKDWNKILTPPMLDGRYDSETGGRSVAELAREQNEDPWNTFFQLVADRRYLLPETMCERNKQLALRQEFVSFCTGAGKIESGIKCHPRNDAAFAYLYQQYVRKQKTLSLEQFVAQAASVAAKQLSIKDRGRIEVGMAADLVAFDALEFRPQATFAHPTEQAAGMKYVIVNGDFAVRDGAFTDKPQGKILRGPGYQTQFAPAEQTTGIAAPELAKADQAMRDFLSQSPIAGAAVAITDQGRLVYARGFGFADVEKREPVQPDSLFRIASVSKPITAAAIMQLVDRNQLSLDDHALDLLPHEPLIVEEKTFDQRLRQITIRHLLHHSGGWDRDQSGDPMFQSPRFRHLLGPSAPVDSDGVIRVVLGRKLDFDPGSRYAYSNFGYCLLGRIIEQITGQTYERYVQDQVLAPLGIRQMRIGATRLSGRVAGEVRYYDPRHESSVFAVDLRQTVLAPYGAWSLEAMDAHGGWIGSAVDLARFATALDQTESCPILSAAALRELDARPDGAAGHDDQGSPKNSYYGGGWAIRVEDDGRRYREHAGSLPGTNSIVVRRTDGRNLIILLNARHTPTTSMPIISLSRRINALLDTIEVWPQKDLFVREKRASPTKRP
ncbi:MAG: serine hydrolase [Blastopirellula sp. JB062]